MIKHSISNLNGWLAILFIVLSSSAGDVLLSRGMKQIGDLGRVRRKRGLVFVILQVLRNRYFLMGVGCMAIAFYSLLFGLSWDDVSLVGPAAASLSFVVNAFAAKMFLHERVDRRRWAAALFVILIFALLGYCPVTVVQNQASDKTMRMPLVDQAIAFTTLELRYSPISSFLLIRMSMKINRNGSKIPFTTCE